MTSVNTQFGFNELTGLLPASRQQRSLFDGVVVNFDRSRQAGLPESIEGKIERAEGVLTRLLEQQTPICASISFGKDSSALLNLLMSAASKMTARNEMVPHIVVTYADTTVESPEMVKYAKEEMGRVKAFAKAHHFSISIEISRPNLTDQWSVRIIGGRALPPFPGTDHACTVDWKIKPMQRLRKRVLKRLHEQSGASGIQAEPVVLIGTRFDESAARSRNMRERGESDTEVRRGVDSNGKPSHLFLSPLAYWSTDDVWEYLGLARSKVIPAYSDFDETFRVYADAMGVSCVIVAEDMSQARSSKACGARHGCSQCTAVGKDASMENMLATDPRYEYMRPLNALRNFIANTRWDMNRRSWLGRTINDGYVRIAADAYSPAMMEELLRYALTIDHNELRASYAAGLSRPRFQLVNMKQLFAIDAMWSLQAFHRPFHALKIYQDIYLKGEQYPVPIVAEFPRPKEMPSKYLYVGSDWDEGDKNTYTGLRSAIHELVRGEGDGCMGNKALSSGKEVLDIENSPVLDFEMETAYFVLDEIEDLIKNHHDNPRSSPTQAYTYYAGLGMMSVKPGMEGEIDYMLRRSAFKIRHGLTGSIDVASLWARAVTAEEAGMTPSTNGKTRKRGEAGSKSTAYVPPASVPFFEVSDEEFHAESPQAGG